MFILPHTSTHAAHQGPYRYGSAVAPAARFARQSRPFCGHWGRASWAANAHSIPDNEAVGVVAVEGVVVVAGGPELVSGAKDRCVGTHLALLCWTVLEAGVKGDGARRGRQLAAVRVFFFAWVSSPSGVVACFVTSVRHASCGAAPSLPRLSCGAPRYGNVAVRRTARARWLLRWSAADGASSTSVLAGAGGLCGCSPT